MAITRRRKVQDERLKGRRTKTARTNPSSGANNMQRSVLALHPHRRLSSNVDHALMFGHDEVVRRGRGDSGSAREEVLTQAPGPPVGRLEASYHGKE
jgi:hypothetical protein